MTHLLRYSLILLTGLLLGLTACTKKEELPPQPGGISGQVLPAGAATLVTATDIAGHTFTAIPDAAGLFRFESLFPGGYSLRFTTSATYLFTGSVPVNVTAGTVTQVPSVAFTPTKGSLSGQVSPARAVTSVTATAAGGTTETVTPTAAGVFSFPALPPGIYELTYSVTADYLAPAPGPAVAVVSSQNTALPVLTLLRTPLAILTGTAWRITANTIVTTTNGQTTTTDVYAQTPACERDDITIFATPNYLIFGEGNTRCSPTAPPATSGTWVFNPGNAALMLTYPSGAVTTFTVLALTSTTLELSETSRPASGTTVVRRIVYVPN